MALSTDFLRQARELATKRGRPSQINLRRANSSAYYALFHLLIEEVVGRMVPAQPPLLRARASRAIQHGEMKQVCNGFRNSLPSKNLQPLLGTQISPSLRFIAATFVALQNERHAADYDISLQLAQSAVLDSVMKVEAAFTQWKAIRATDEANVFLAALVFGKKWER